MYVSITGLKLKSTFYLPMFSYHAMRSMNQAKSASGNIRAEARTINGIHHTLSVWQSKDDMLIYIRTGAHAEALKIFSRIATGKIVSMITDSPPDWSEVHQLWLEQGKEV